MAGSDSSVNGVPQSDAAARASLLRMEPWKWRLVRAFEHALRLFLPLLPSPRANEGGAAPPRNILVVEYWNLGDLVIVMPFLKNLRRSFPSARITLLVNAGLALFLKGQGIADEFISVRVPWAQHFSRWKKYNPFSASWISFVRTLLTVRSKRFDWAFSGRMDIRDNLLLWLSGAPRRVGYGFGGGGLFLTDCVVPDLTRPHRADVWLHLLASLGEPTDRNTNGFHLTNAEFALADSFLQQEKIPDDAFLVGIHPGARLAVRRWGDERFAEVAQHIVAETDAHILWFSDPANPSDAPKVDRCYAASTDFRCFLALLSRCKLLVCNDSGPMHLANLLGVPVVAVFGSTNPVWFGPRGANDRVVIRSEFWCRPCFDYCIFDQPYCLQTIAPVEVIALVRAAIQEIRPCALTRLDSHARTSARERATDV